MCRKDAKVQKKKQDVGMKEGEREGEGEMQGEEEEEKAEIGAQFFFSSFFLPALASTLYALFMGKMLQIQQIRLKFDLFPIQSTIDTPSLF